MTIPFLHYVARDLIAKYDDGLSRICVVVPSQRAHKFLLSYLSKELKKTFIAPKIITIDELMSSLSGLNPIDNMQLLLEMFILNKEINPGGDNDMIKFSGWAQQFLGDINDIDLHLVDAKALFTTVADIKELALFNTPEQERSARQKAWLIFFKKLYVFYEKFNISLLQRHMGYQGMIYRYVAEHVHELIETISESKIVFCGFNALTVSEQKLFDALMKEGKADIYWDADNYYLKDPMRDAGRFMRQNFNVLKIEKPSLISDHLTQSEKTIHVVAAQNNIAQAKYVGELLSVDSSMDLSNTVIVPADESLLLPLLYSIPVDKMNVTMGLPISQTQLYSLFVLIFEMQQTMQRTTELKPRYKDKFYVKDIVALLSHVHITEFGKRNGVDFDGLCLEIQRSKRHFLTVDELIKFSGATGLSDFLNTLFAPWNNSVEAIAMMQKLLGLIAQSLIGEATQKELNGNPEKLIFTNTYYALTSVFERLAEVGKMYSDVIDVPNLRFLFDSEAQKETLSFKGDAEVGLQLMGVLETRTLDFENIIFCSVNEGVLPTGKSVNSLIPFDVKRYYDLPSYQYKDAVFAYHFFRLLQRAKNVHILYNEGGSDGKAERSRFVDQLMLELPRVNPRVNIIEQSIQIDAKMETLPSITVAKTETVMEAIKSINRFSPSSLSKYINCPLQFYFASVLRLKKPDELLEEADDATLGNVIHGVLEDLYTPFINAKINLKPVDPKRMDELVRKHFANPNHKVVLTDDELDFGRNRLVREIAVRYIENVLNSDMQANNTVVLRSLEEELSFGVTIADHPVTFYGKADRIDQLENGTIRIIDYKTGRVDAAKLKVTVIPEMFVKPDLGKAFQLMMYGLMYHRQVSANSQLCSGIVSTRDKNAPFSPLQLVDSEIIDHELLAEFEQNLINMLHEIHDPALEFAQTSDIKRCSYCDYKSVCNR